MRILVTGCAGFIGYHLCKELLNNKKFTVYGLDNLNKYYDVNLKKNRLNILKKNSKKFIFYKLDLCNYKKILNNFKKNKYNIVIHLAAQAGVRFSIKNPQKYLDNNIIGFYNILESSRSIKSNHLIYASTSSVYGNNNNFPLKENYSTSRPQSFYAATKKTNEIMAYSFSNIYNIPCTGLRFFTVYGEYGRPDMSLHKFVKAILENKKIELYNYGNHVRDFTYVNDVVEGLIKIIKKPSKNKIPHQIFNIGSNNPISLKQFIKIIEKILNKKGKYEYRSIQKGDVVKTHADISMIKKHAKFKTNTSIHLGIYNFIEWYKAYYK